MAGLAFMYEEYKKDPDRIEKLLSGDIEIVEKLSAARFFVQVNNGRELNFFKRKDAQITKIDRTLSKYYEKAINHFETLPYEKLEMCPDGWRFGMEYLCSSQPVTIMYDRLPLNNLVLTDIQVRDPRDRTLEIITDKDTLSKWAEILEVEKPPIVFDGKLNDSQRRKLLDFLNAPYSTLIDRFKTENFTFFILTLLNPSLKSSFLNNDLSKDIDGLVFKFGGKEVFRVSNPDMMSKKQNKREEKPSDIYNLTMVILQEFITGLDFKKIKLKEKTFEERYIEFICKVYNIFMQSHYYMDNFSSGVDFELPKFLTREESEVNFDFVGDEDTRGYLRLSNTNRELFKIMLASMRSHKKRASGFFSKELIYHHNMLVDKIADYINSNLKESFFSFDEFKTVFIGESNTWQEFGEDIAEKMESSVNERDLDVNFPSFDHVSRSQEYDTVKCPMTTLKKMFNVDEKADKEKKQDEISVMRGKFFPFHNGHVSAIQDLCNESGLKTYLIVSCPLEGEAPNELHKSMMDEVINNNKNVCGYKFINGCSWGEISQEIPDTYKVKYFSGNEEECNDVKIQLDDITIVLSTQHMDSKNIIKKIIDDDSDGYKKLVPEYLKNYFYKIRNEIK